MNQKYLEELYLEGLFLLSDYTIGFELEGFAESEKTLNLFKAFTKTVFKPDYSITIPEVLKREGHFASDYSIEVKLNEKSFEYKSPVFKLTPLNIQKIIQFLTLSAQNYIKVNSSCGFHIHIGVPETSVPKDIDMLWILSNLAVSEKGKEKFSKMFYNIIKYKDFKLYTDEYASLETIDKIQYAFNQLKTENDTELFKKRMSYVFTGEKFTVLRIHPQGTFEWRGPREFLAKGNQRAIVSGFFMQKLVPFIRWINDMLEIKKIQHGDIIISRKMFDYMVKKFDPVIHDPKRFKGMTDEEKKNVMTRFKWLKNAKFENAELHIDDEDDELIMISGTWLDGAWIEGNFEAIWMNGTFKGGKFGNLGTWHNGVFENGIFDGKEWYDGIFKNGYFKGRDWFDGEFLGGIFEGGQWWDGTFKGGVFHGGSWHDGIWVDGEWKAFGQHPNEKLGKRTANIPPLVWTN